MCCCFFFFLFYIAFLFLSVCYQLSKCKICSVNVAGISVWLFEQTLSSKKKLKFLVSFGGFLSIESIGVYFVSLKYFKVVQEPLGLVEMGMDFSCLPGSSFYLWINRILLIYWAMQKSRRLIRNIVCLPYFRLQSI